MEPLVNQHIIVNGTRIAHGVHGEGEPVVLIHGTPSSSLIWRNVLPQLTSAGYKVHVFDLLGYGLSERPWDPSTDTSISGQVPILEALFRHWGLEERKEDGQGGAHVVAHDIGGGIVQRLAVFSPHLFRSLTLVDVVSFDSYPSRRTREQMEKGLESLIKAPDEDHKAHFREWLLSAVHDKEKFKDASLETFIGYISGPVGQASFFQHQVRHYDPKHTMEVAHRLPEIGRSMPVQIIWGAEEQWQVTDWAHRLHKTIPGSELHIVEGCGHLSLEDEPGKIAELVKSFISKK